MKANDFFCGAGGMGLGFKQAGFDLVGAWDFDKFAVQSYAHNVSPKVKLADISKMTWDEVPYADVWTFGFPCQDISVAGNQAGMVKGQTRSGLFYEIMRLLEETETYSPDRLPAVLLAENVKAIDQYLPEIEKEYRVRGYILYAVLYNSKHWGVPQNRERYFIVGVHKSIEKSFEFVEQPFEVTAPLAKILEEQVGAKYNLRVESAEAIISSYCANFADQDYSPYTIKKVGNVNPSGRGMNGGVFSANGMCPTLTTNKGEGIKIIIPSEVRSNLSGYRVRRLTPRESARLQGFPDDYVQVVSNSQFYKQMGNAVTVTISRSIAEQIRCFLKD